MQNCCFLLFHVLFLFCCLPCLQWLMNAQLWQGLFCSHSSSSLAFCLRYSKGSPFISTLNPQFSHTKNRSLLHARWFASHSGHRIGPSISIPNIYYILILYKRVLVSEKERVPRRLSTPVAEKTVLFHA